MAIPEDGCSSTSSSSSSSNGGTTNTLTPPLLTTDSPIPLRVVDQHAYVWEIEGQCEQEGRLHHT